MRWRHDPASAVLRVWRWPIILALLSIFGLLSALLGQGGIWWPLSWGALSIPLLTIVWHCHAVRRRRTSGGGGE